MGTPRPSGITSGGTSRRAGIAAAVLAFVAGAIGGAVAQATWSDYSAPPVAAMPEPPVVAPGVEPAGEEPSAPNFVYRYLAPPSPALAEVATQVRDRDLLRKLPEVQWLDGLLMLPETITYVAMECGEPDAYYLPDKREVVLCYEMMQVLYEQGAELATSGDVSSVVGPDAAADAAPSDIAQRYVWANLRFIASHETGHALIELLDLPVTGRQEDAVDQFATSVMQRIGGEHESPEQVAANLRLAGHWFLARADTGFSLDAYADTHSLGLQRYFNLQCLLYGSDPERFAGIVARGDLPESRARYCPAEAGRASEAWMRLLRPHLAPRYAMTEAEAAEWMRQRGEPAPTATPAQR